jgi:DNA-binding FadR family transcriptional regulator
MDCSGNITLSLMGAALEGTVTGHISLLYGTSSEADWWTQSTLSMRSRKKLARIIGQGDAEGAATHWTAHMERTGRTWLSGVSQHAMVNIVDYDPF